MLIHRSLLCLIALIVCIKGRRCFFVILHGLFQAWDIRISPQEEELTRPTGKNVYVICQVEFEEDESQVKPQIDWLRDGSSVNAFNVR